MDTATNIYWHRTKMVLKFVWRHLLTIPMVFLLILSICMGDVGNILTWGFCTIWASIMDRAKCNRSSRGKSTDKSPFEQYYYHDNDKWNPHRVGTAAYFIDQAGKR